MKVDLSQIPGQDGLQIKTRSDAYTNSLKEGDRVRVVVLSADKDSVTVKTEGGQVFKARLDTDALLSQGDRVLLEYSGKEGKLVFLSIMGREEPLDETPALSALVRDFDDKSLAPFAGKLAELRMTVTEETARVMRDLTIRNPGMALEEAAFLASNKLSGDDSLVRAALALLSNGDKTDAMLMRLIALLTSADAPAQTEKVNSQLPRGTELPSLYPQLPARDGPSPLTDWLRLVETSVAGENTVNAERFTEQGQPPGTQTDPGGIISQRDTVLQSRNVINYVENQQNEVYHVEKSVSELQNLSFSKTGPATEPGTDSGQKSSSILYSEKPSPETTGPQFSVEDPAQLHSPFSAQEKTPFSARGAEIPSSGSQPPAPETGSVIAGILSNVPEFRGTPPPVLERFSNMLLRVARDSSETAGGDVAKLADLVDKLFTRIEKNDKSAGERLRSAREELFARLTVIEESISRAAQPARTEMLEQTRRLMDHVRLLNSIDQFAYLQLPVSMGEERKTAELYLFKRRNGKRADPENVNILLALDLENMGHWEGLINIRNKDVSIRMEVQRAEEKDYFSDQTVMLHELLSESGFRLVSASVTCREEETTPLTALSVFDRYVNAQSCGIDLTI